MATEYRLSDFLLADFFPFFEIYTVIILLVDLSVSSISFSATVMVIYVVSSNMKMITARNWIYGHSPSTVHTTRTQTHTCLYLQHTHTFNILSYTRLHSYNRTLAPHFCTHVYTYTSIHSCNHAHNTHTQPLDSQPTFTNYFPFYEAADIQHNNQFPSTLHNTQQFLFHSHTIYPN